jgi:hypothetical protein
VNVALLNYLKTVVKRKKNSFKNGVPSCSRILLVAWGYCYKKLFFVVCDVAAEKLERLSLKSFSFGL